MRPLSVIITTLNEAENIEGVIASVEGADEVLVIDSFSQDDTRLLAEENGATVFERKYEGPADQKNWAIPQARNEWILILDADERVTPTLWKEIQQILEQKDILYDGFWISRQNHFMRQKVNYSGWQGDAVIRLIRRDVCRYNNKQVHEEIETDGIKIGKLSNKMDHYTFKNAEHFLDKMQRYGEWSARDHAAKTKSIGILQLFGKPFFRFIKHYFIQRGFLDGRVGFIISVIMAWGVFLRYLYMLELKNTDTSQSN